MLKLRVITALVLGPLILWSVLSFNHRLIALELGGFLCIGAWEWARLSGFTQPLLRISIAFMFAGVLAFIGLLMHQSPSLVQPLLYFASLLWIGAIIAIAYFNRAPVVALTAMSLQVRLLSLLIGVCILLCAFVAIVALHQNANYGAYYLLALLILIWVADSAAYFTGKAFGRHKLARNVSPGKTWEGVIGAVCGVSVAAYLLAVYFLNIAQAKVVTFVAIALCVMVVSIAGDLIVSLFKRRAGVKDSSHILPGHGGILDRIDSLLAAAPIMLLGLLIMDVK